MTRGGRLVGLVTAALLAWGSASAAVRPTPIARVVAPVSPAVSTQDEAPTEPVSSLTAADVTVQRPDPVLPIGSWFDLVVTGPGLQSLRLDAADHVGDVLVGRVKRTTSPDGRVELRRPVCVAREGAYALPFAVVDDTGATLALDPVTVEVVLELPDGAIPRVADLLAPVAVPMPPPEPWPFLVAALGGLFVLGWFIVASGREKPVYVYVPPADRVALDALAELRRRLPRTTEEIRPFVIRVSDVLRVYVEDVFRLHAPALTTEEFLVQASRRHDALGARRESLADFLQRCDLVKYAGERPAPAAAEPLLDTVETFVVETRGAAGPSDAPDAVTGVVSPAGREHAAAVDARARGGPADAHGHSADAAAPAAADPDTSVAVAEPPREGGPA